MSGEMIKNPNGWKDRPGRHDFEIGLMYGLSLTLKTFVPDPRFNSNGAKYRSGVICSVCEVAPARRRFGNSTASPGAPDRISRNATNRDAS